MFSRWVRWVHRSRAWLTAIWTAYLPRSAAPRPAVRLELSPWVSASVLRLVAGLLALVAAAQVGQGPVTGTVLALLALAVVVFPGGVAPAAVIAVVALVAVLSPAPSSPWPAALLIAALHAMAQLSLLVGRVSWRARVELRALVRPAPRFFVVQLGVQTLAWLGGGLRDYRLDLGVLPLLALLGLGVVTFVWLPRLLGPETPPS